MHERQHVDVDRGMIAERTPEEVARAACPGNEQEQRRIADRIRSDRARIGIREPEASSGIAVEPRDPARRSTWDDYFLRIAKEVATRATCDRKHVGAVLVRDRNILATGYNGSLRGLDHCDDVGHQMEDGHCVRTVHAEANAIVQAVRNGVRLDGAIAYVTAFPCLNCFKLLAQAGIVRIVYIEPYRPSSTVVDAASMLGISVEQASANLGPHAGAAEVEF